MPGTYNSDGVNMSGGNSEPFPEGDYHLRVISVDPGKIQSGPNAGCDKVTVGFAVIGGEHAGREINYYTVSFLPKDAKGASMALKFLKCIGEPYEGEFSWDERRWEGRVLKAFVTIGQPDKKGRKWNEIKWVNEPDAEWYELYRKAGQKEEDCPF